MESERYNSGDRKTAGDGVNPECTVVTDLDAFIEGFGAEITPLEIPEKDVQNKVIHSFKQTSTNVIYEKWRKRICEFCDEQLEEAELAGHDCSHMECSMLIFNQGMKDELMVIIYHKMTVEAENVEDEDVQELRGKDGDQEKEEAQLIKAQIPVQIPDLEKCEDQIISLDEKMEFKEKTRKTRSVRKRRTRFKETQKKKGEKVQQVINDGTRNVRKRKFKQRKEAIRKNSKKEKIRKKKRMKVRKRSESVGGETSGRAWILSRGRVAKRWLFGCLQQRGRTTKKGYLRNCGSGSCGGGSGGGPGGRRSRRKRKSPVFSRKKRGKEEKAEEKFKGVAGKNGSNGGAQKKKGAAAAEHMCLETEESGREENSGSDGSGGWTEEINVEKVCKVVGEYDIGGGFTDGGERGRSVREVLNLGFMGLKESEWGNKEEDDNLGFVFSDVDIMSDVNKDDRKKNLQLQSSGAR